jgi:hypothetical protein
MLRLSVCNDDERRDDGVSSQNAAGYKRWSVVTGTMPSGAAFCTYKVG